MEYSLQRHCPSAGQLVEHRYTTRNEWFVLVGTTCADLLGHSFGRMCPCWKNGSNEKGMIDILIVHRREPGLWPQAMYALRRWMLDEHSKTAAVEIIIRAATEGFISRQTAVEALKGTSITNPYEQGTIFAFAAEIGLDLAPFAYLFGDKRFQQIAKRENVRAAFGRLSLGEIGYAPHPQALRYIRRLEGDAVIEPLMTRYEQMLKRVAYGRLCAEIGWALPDLNENERAQRENYLFFQTVREIFADASTDDCCRYVLGNLLFEPFTLPNQTKGGIFRLWGGNALTIAEAKAYIKKYAGKLQQVVDQW